ncbi:phage tail sheath family protein [Bradyrhizobium tropiciagri]|uniref:phage tail sheath family protein n=1 Tax=Bradyrhizobium tropiciagri TaxID=312253 RepID=UPI00067D766E|nr:phage tail sheath C-terminal domain-containing protein [Bradyrhizobium tropiciagri]
MAQAVSQFFLNGGTHAFVVSVNQPSSKSTASALGKLVPQPLPPFSFPLSPPLSPPAGWPAQSIDIGGIVFTQREVTDEIFVLSVVVNPAAPISPAAYGLADIIITYGPSSKSASSGVATGSATTVETYRRVSLDPASPNYIINAMAASSLVSVSLSNPGPATFTATGATPIFFPLLISQTTQIFALADFTAVLQEDTPLDKLQVFNLMVLPGIAPSNDSDGSAGVILAAAVAFCERKHAFLIMDPPIRDSADGTLPPNSHKIADSVSAFPASKNAALYFPYLLTPDPITGQQNGLVSGQPSEIPPAATVAGIYAATDVARGVWKAPAGFQAITNNVTGVTARGAMTDNRQGTLNPLGVNCLRAFPNLPTIVFGSRTLATTDQQWTYVPVRRMALFLEQTLLANLKWVLFEPNAEPLWSAITMSINAFMLGLFKQGAFQGQKPSEAFLVKCDGTTTTQADIDSGIVNIVVGFAPLKPAEFVIITIAQLAGQTQTS